MRQLSMKKKMEYVNIKLTLSLNKITTVIKKITVVPAITPLGLVAVVVNVGKLRFAGAPGSCSSRWVAAGP